LSVWCRRPEAQLARRVARAQSQEAYALQEAEVYAAAAASAIRDAEAARRRAVSDLPGAP
jgi:hypothetical protein